MGPTFLYGYSEKSPHLVAFYDAGDTENILDLTPRVLTGIFNNKMKVQKYIHIPFPQSTQPFPKKVTKDMVE